MDSLLARLAHPGMHLPTLQVGKASFPDKKNFLGLAHPGMHLPTMQVGRASLPDKVFLGTSPLKNAVQAKNKY